MSIENAETGNGPTQSRRAFLKTSAGVLGGLALGQAPLQNLSAKDIPSGRKPNIIIYLGEGVRSNELGCTGNQIIHTPNFDRIAREGMLFRNAFTTNALCAPSRATLLTGRYSHSINVLGNEPIKWLFNDTQTGNGPIPKETPLVSELLHQAGYETGFFGRAHCRGALRDRYWDYYLGFNIRTDYFKPVLMEGIAGNYSEKKLDGFVDDVVTDGALKWLEQERDKPFFLFMNPFTPHAPFYRARRHLDLYNGVKIPKPVTFDDDLKGYPGKPTAFVDANNKIGTTLLGDDDPRTLEEVVKDHYAGVVNNDENLGRLIDWLEHTGKLDDTIIIVTSDHGFFLGEWRMYDKRFMHEPSIRVPFLVRYPGMVKAGSRCEQAALNVDVAPTLLELAGVNVSPAMHGRSLVPLLKGEKPENWRKDWLYENFEYPGSEKVRPHYGVRTERHKLIHYYKISAYPELPEEFELYDLQKDPGERYNLYGKPGYSTLTQQLMNRISELRKETGDNYTETAAPGTS